MKTITEKQNFPIKAGMPTNNRNDMKLRKVGVKTIEFTYLLHDDGDKQLMSEKEIKRRIFK